MLPSSAEIRQNPRWVPSFFDDDSHPEITLCSQFSYLPYLAYLSYFTYIITVIIRVRLSGRSCQSKQGQIHG